LFNWRHRLAEQPAIGHPAVRRRSPNLTGDTVLGRVRVPPPRGERIRAGPVPAVLLLTALVRLLPTEGGRAGLALVVGHAPSVASALMNNLWKTLRLS
jgi:hypothetical protein